ncbi:MAG TPA: hypothetical protein VLL97_02390 [Acidobacteriota bacterium]|nr:hypothetical protein [Acidobacteriota bacterium]
MRQESIEIRRKLATLIGHLIRRCIDEARLIPTVLHREEVINLLVDNPDLFARLVREEHRDKTELSKEDLTMKLDAVAELAKLDRLELYAQSFWDGPEADLAPVMDLTAQLTRTFAVYLGNAATLFDREFGTFMDKFRDSLQRAGMTLRKVEFSLENMAAFEETAAAYLPAGDFLQAFTFEKLFASQIMMKQLVILPETYSLRENLMKRAIVDPALCPSLIRFVLRISYISQGDWEDLVSLLMALYLRESGQSGFSRLIDDIEKDVVFSCNLLCRSYEEIRRLSPDQRRAAIESGLEKYGGARPSG